MYILSVSTFSLNSSFSILKKENNTLKTIFELDLHYNDINNQSQLNIFPHFFKLAKDKVGINLKDIKEIIILNGPGFFTSLRIGTVISQTLAFINKSDLYSIDTFKAVLNIFLYFYSEYVDTKAYILIAIKIANNKFKIGIFNINNYLEQQTYEEIIKTEFYNKLSELKNKLGDNLIVISPNMETEEIEEIENLGLNFIDLKDLFTSSNIAKSTFFFNNFKKEDPTYVTINY